MLVDLLVALGLAAVLTATFGLAAGWRRPSDLPHTEQRGAMQTLFFFAVTLLTWTGGGWLTAHDPAWAPRWLTFLLAALIASLVVVSLVVSEQRWRTPGAQHGATGWTAASALRLSPPARVAPGLTALFWGLLAGVLALAALLWTLQPG